MDFELEFIHTDEDRIALIRESFTDDEIMFILSSIRFRIESLKEKGEESQVVFDSEEGDIQWEDATSYSAYRHLENLFREVLSIDDYDGDDDDDGEREDIDVDKPEDEEDSQPSKLKIAI